MGMVVHIHNPSTRKLRGEEGISSCDQPWSYSGLETKNIIYLCTKKKSFHVYQKSEQFIPEIQVQIQPIAPTELYILISGIRREHDIPFVLGLPFKSFFPPPIVNFLQYRWNAELNFLPSHYWLNDTLEQDTFTKESSKEKLGLSLIIHPCKKVCNICTNGSRSWQSIFAWSAWSYCKG